jgi:copper chaperone
MNKRRIYMSTVTYSVPNISCGHCIHTIQTEVSDLKGVKSVKADLSTKKVEIIYEPPASEEQIKALLAEIDYPVAA